MNVNEIADVLEVSTILQQPHKSASELIADLINWRDKATVADKPKRGSKATPRTKMDDSVQDDSFEASPDPSASDEPDF